MVAEPTDLAVTTPSIISNILSSDVDHTISVSAISTLPLYTLASNTSLSPILKDDDGLFIFIVTSFK